MKKYLLVLFVLTGFIYGKVNSVVSIVPQKVFVEAIGGDKVDVSAMVKAGSSPHTYEPKPSQMKDIAKADIYFSIGFEFEEAWLPKFANQNKNMQIVDLSKGITKLEMKEHHHEEEGHEEDVHHDHDEHEDEKHENHEHEKHENDGHEDEEHHEHDGLDPHVWLSPSNIKVIAKNILDTLVQKDSVNKAYYEKRYDAFIVQINKTQATIKDYLKDTPKDAKFMVFHPSWGYFAQEFHLEQFAIEVSGKNPKPKQIAYIIEEAKEEGVKAIFTAPEFSDKVAKQIANELDIKVIKVSPLSEKWSETLIKLAKTIANK